MYSVQHVIAFIQLQLIFNGHEGHEHVVPGVVVCLLWCIMVGRVNARRGP